MQPTGAKDQPTTGHSKITYASTRGRGGLDIVINFLMYVGEEGPKWKCICVSNL